MNMVEIERALRQLRLSAPAWRLEVIAEDDDGIAAVLDVVEVHADRAQAVAGLGPVRFGRTRGQIVAVRAVLLAGQVTQHRQALGMRQRLSCTGSPSARAM